MNADKLQRVLTHYGFETSFDSEKENTFYFRTNDDKYVIRVIVNDNNIEIDRANEDFYQEYPADFYIYSYPEAVFTYEELLTYGWLDEVK